MGVSPAGLVVVQRDMKCFFRADQHHQFFTCNYGAFTTIWDRLFGTVRGRFEQDFVALKGRRLAVIQTPEVARPFAEMKE